MHVNLEVCKGVKQGNMSYTNSNCVVRLVGGSIGWCLYIFISTVHLGARSSMVFSVDLTLPAALWSTQPPTEMRTKDLPGG
jgi:hypothetical protein